MDLKNFTPQQVRNFSIIAHIDHGKSTLSDRLLEYTGTLSDRVRHEQFLDKLQVEKERGITVKAQTASMIYEYQGQQYILNLIDTPGHVDFSYEVSRSLYACQGALLLVDASQGVEAQTMANFYLAFDQDLTIIPVINKVDMATANVERALKELDKLFDYKPEEVLKASGKAGIGIQEILGAVITRIPAPEVNPNSPLKALLFDSWFDDYRGVVCLIAVHDGHIRKGDMVTLAQTGNSYEVLELGIMYPDQTPMDALYAGQVGYVITGMKTVKEARVGDTVYHTKKPVPPFPGFKPAKPVVFAGIYPVESTEFELLRDAIEKLTLNDASVTTEKKTSPALGLGFRCGFLGLLHMEVFKQRLEQEYNLSVIATAPSVLYKVKLEHNKQIIDIENPSEFPEPSQIEEILEPIITATIIVPKNYLGNIITLCEEKRGKQISLTYLDEDRIILKYRLPLAEVATDFYDRLKSVSAGYASFDYEESGYEPADLIKMDILLNGKAVDALSCIVHEDKAYYIGRDLVSRLRQVIPRQLFEVAIQAAIGSKIIARESVSALRKDVTAKCYGGDISRKRKLLEKQKEGKKRMKQVGNVEVPQEAFLTILKR
ncbi:GTP-binding protein LepA [candidate division TM6 bacterium JCVI TM6SC1]|uniref:Elongation factor 4 n=1 Tax=candidate division TM6 bacterium JCVI TM6SC1 TaxID=1306947 RepID=A0A0D2I3L7_9BACT|nr:GTP-binding protein LepA [candidate division TM6 bacterium JCVI TM6SC1]